MNRANELLQVAFNAYAPIESQKNMIKEIKELERDAAPDARVAIVICEALLLGLRNNYWLVRRLRWNGNSYIRM